MKLFWFVILANAEKCSKPCGTGYLTDGLECNVEPCSFYDELNYLQNGRMDNSQDNSWTGNGATITHQRVSYHNGGYLVSHRTASWRGIKQDFTSDHVINLRNKSFNVGMYVRPAPGAFLNKPVKFQLMARSIINEEATYLSIGSVEYTVHDNLLEWKQMKGTVTVPDSTEQFRIYVQANDNTLDFEVDHSYFVNGNRPPVDQLIINGDFEEGELGWNKLSHSFTLHNTDSPSGRTHAKMGSRTKSNQGFKQELDMTKLDESDFVEVSFWAKLTDEKNNAELQDLTAKISCSTTLNTEYIFAANGCGVIDDKWYKYSGVADLRACKRSSSMKINIAQPDPGIMIHLDQVSVTNYARDLSWRHAASLRTDELRKQKTIIDIRDPKTKMLEIRMLKNGYPFGATINKFIMGDEYDRTNWPVLFNYGVGANEFKWKAHEKKQFEIKYDDADAINKQMKEWNVPLRGHAVTWSVPNHNPVWFEQNPTLDALYNRTDDVVLHFANDITQWDVLNEPLHGNFFRKHFGDEIWSDMFERVKAVDPKVKITINDYNIVRADKGRCYNRLTSNVDIDYAGLQSHIHPGLNGHFLKQRFDTLANDNNDTDRRLWITEFDIDNDFDVDFKADDLDDFMRSAFSHPAVDGIMAWKWLWTEPSNSGVVTKHFFDSKEKDGAIVNRDVRFSYSKAKVFL